MSADTRLTGLTQPGTAIPGTALLYYVDPANTTDPIDSDAQGSGLATTFANLAASLTPTMVDAVFGNVAANQVYASPASGAAAPPAFRSLVDADLSSNVPLKNASNTFTVSPQTITIDADAHTGLIVTAHSATQSGPLVQLTGGAANSAARLTDRLIQWTRTSDGAYVSSISSDGSNITINARNNVIIQGNGTTCITFASNTITFAAGVTTLSFTSLSFTANQIQSASVGLIVTNDRATSPALIVRNDDAQSADTLQFVQKSSTTNARLEAAINSSWATSTDASRKGRLIIGAHDAATSTGAPREGFRVESNGSAAMLGFLGAAAVVQQANASQAGITAVTDANAQAALQAIYNLLVQYGLAPATA